MRELFLQRANPRDREIFNFLGNNYVSVHFTLLLQNSLKPIHSLLLINLIHAQNVEWNSLE